jgi:hypothetical protein
MLRLLPILTIFLMGCGDGGPPTFSEGISEMPESERHRYCYNCQDKCFRDYQRTANDLYDWQKDWKVCLQGCSRRFLIDAGDCQYRDKEYLIHREKREPPEQKKKDED